MMAEEQVTTGEEAPRLSKNSKWLGFVFAFVCISASVAIFAVLTCLRQNCLEGGPRSPIVQAMLAILGALLFFLGLSILAASCRRRKNSSPTPQVAFCGSIAAADLETSFAPTLPYSQAADGQAFVIEASSLELPDYFTATQNTSAVYSSMDSAFWSPNVHEILPPSYEEAMELSGNIRLQLQVTCQ